MNTLTRQENRTTFVSRRVLHIHTWTTGGPADEAWAACFGEYDLGVKVFTGRTQREATNELLDYHEQDNGEIRP